MLTSLRKSSQPWGNSSSLLGLLSLSCTGIRSGNLRNISWNKDNKQWHDLELSCSSKRNFCKWVIMLSMYYTLFCLTMFYIPKWTISLRMLIALPSRCLYTPFQKTQFNCQHLDKLCCVVLAEGRTALWQCPSLVNNAAVLFPALATTPTWMYRAKASH